MIRKYVVLNKNEYRLGDYQIVPIREEDKYGIMEMRNDQLFHLRQANLLTVADQDKYFSEVVSKLFEKHNPDQLLFSYLKNDILIGYGGLVHINWVDVNAEISFIIFPGFENEFEFHWKNFLSMLEEVAFTQLKFHKIFTYAFDLRPRLYPILEKVDYLKEATLKEHCFYDNKYIDVVIHSKIKHVNL